MINGRKLNLDLIHQLELIATQGLVPDITLWFDLTVEESFHRRGGRTNDRIESEGLDFLQRVASGFRKLAKERNWTKVSAELSQDLVSKEIQEVLVKNFIIKS